MNTELSTPGVKSNRKAGTAIVEGDLYEPTEFGWRRTSKGRKWVSWLVWLGGVLATPWIYVYRRVRASVTHRAHS